MSEKEQSSSRFTVNGYKLLIGFSLFALLMSIVGFLLVIWIPNKQVPLKLMLFGFWGQIFIGVGYLYALAEKHLRSLLLYKRILLGVFIAAAISGGWFGWDYGSSHYAKGVIVHDGEISASGLARQLENGRLIREQQNEYLYRMIEDQRFNHLLSSHVTPHLVDSLWNIQTDTVWGMDPR